MEIALSLEEYSSISKKINSEIEWFLREAFANDPNLHLSKNGKCVFAADDEMHRIEVQKVFVPFKISEQLRIISLSRAIVSATAMIRNDCELLDWDLNPKFGDNGTFTICMPSIDIDVVQ